MLPNINQVLSLVRAVMLVAGTVVTAKSKVSVDDWQMYTGAILTITPVVWSLLAHTDAAQLKAVEAMPEVALVIPVPNAAPDSAVAIAAEDPARPKVTT